MVDKAALLKGFLPEADVELPSGLGTVRVRGLSRIEAVQLSRRIERGEFDQAEGEVVAIAHGMLDPQMTEDEVQAWRQVTVAADVQAVAQKISELSNLDKQGGKGPTSTSRRAKN